MKKSILLLTILLLSLLLFACSKNSSETIDIRGEVKEIYMGIEGLAMEGFLVEGEVHQDTIYDSASVTINKDTKIYKDGTKSSLEEIEEGIVVEVIFEGPVAESHPIQGVAKEIRIQGD